MTGGTISHVDKKQMGEEIGKRRKISLVKQESDSYGDDFFTASPCLVNLGDGVRIITVAAGGRHTLALSGKSTCVLDHQHKFAYGLRCGCRFFVVTLHSFVGCMKHEAMEDF